MAHTKANRRSQARAEMAAESRWDRDELIGRKNRNLGISPGFVREVLDSSGIVVLIKDLNVHRPDELIISGTRDVDLSGLGGDSLVNSWGARRKPKSNDSPVTRGVVTGNRFTIPYGATEPIVVDRDESVNAVDITYRPPMAMEILPSRAEAFVPQPERSFAEITVSRIGFERLIEFMPDGSAVQKAAHIGHQTIFG